MDKELFKKLFVNEAKGALLRGGGGGGSATVTTVGGWSGTAVPNSGTVGTFYINFNLTIDEVLAIVNDESFNFIDMNGTQIYPVVMTADGSFDLTIMKQNEAVVIMGNTDSGMLPIFAYKTQEVMGFEDGWIAEVQEDLINGYPLNSEVISEMGGLSIGTQNDLLSPLVSTTPFVMNLGEPIQLTGEYNGATVKAEEGGDIDVKTLLDEKKLPLTIKAPQKAIVSKEGDFLPGTTVPNEGYVENIYVNTELSNEEMIDVLSGIDYLLFNSYEGTTGDIVISNNTDKMLVILKGWGRTEVSYIDPTIPNGTMLIWSSEEGWGGIIDYDSVLTFNSDASTNNEFVTNQFQYPEYTGHIGAQNNKLNLLFSTTPFEKDEGETLILSGEYDGTPLKISESVDLYSLIKYEKKIPFALELQIWKTYQDIDYLITDNICYFKSDVNQYSYIDYDSLPWKDVTEAYILPKTKRISSQSFRNCSNLTEIGISNTVEYIEDLAFAGCTSLKNAVIPDSVISMGDAFSGCTSLETVVIKSTSIESLVRGIFLNCTSLTDISLPSSITSIGNYAFENCTSLTNINYSGTIEQWNAISKSSNWNKNTGNYTVHCTDGDIAKA